MDEEKGAQTHPKRGEYFEWEAVLFSSVILQKWSIKLDGVSFKVTFLLASS